MRQKGQHRVESNVHELKLISSYIHGGEHRAPQGWLKRSERVSDPSASQVGELFDAVVCKAEQPAEWGFDQCPDRDERETCCLGNEEVDLGGECDIDRLGRGKLHRVAGIGRDEDLNFDPFRSEVLQFLSYIERNVIGIGEIIKDKADFGGAGCGQPKAQKNRDSHKKNRDCNDCDMASSYPHDPMPRVL